MAAAGQWHALVILSLSLPRWADNGITAELYADNKHDACALTTAISLALQQPAGREARCLRDHQVAADDGVGDEEDRG